MYSDFDSDYSGEECEHMSEVPDKGESSSNANPQDKQESETRGSRKRVCCLELRFSNECDQWGVGNRQLEDLF